MHDFEESFAEEAHAMDIKFSKINDQDRKIYNEVDSFHNCLTPLDLQKAMMEEIGNVQAIAPHLTTTKARLFLNKYKWNVNDVLCAAYDLKEEKFSKNPTKNAKQCEICFEEFAGLLSSLPCDHFFCDECIRGYIINFVTEEGGMNREAINCPGYQCKFQLDDCFVINLLVNNQDASSKYIKMITKNYVMNCGYIKSCPRGSCFNVIKIEEGEISETFSVCCSCCNWFCFKCQETAHDPLTCQMAEKWREFCRSDHLSNTWIQNYTKKCPNCQTNIEKNGGCMHMTCRNCRHEFCWVCFAKWGHHNCDRSSGGGDGKGDEGKFSKRFEHFNNHFQNMRQLLKRDEQLEELLNFEEVVEFEDTILRTKFLKDARQTLQKCRSTLMYTYAFFYYWTSTDNRIYMLEQNLTSLEETTEKLSKLLWSIELENLQENQTKVLDVTLICRKFCNSIIEHVREGETKGWWLKFPIPVDYYSADDNNNNGIF